ncbi:MAG: hypothetical protein LAP61_24400 [Acidobacteriia bacterium]|nr:hypothetical protein [Terriglobia bacterium]
MTKFRSSYATICAVLVLALTMGAIVSHGPVAPPDGDGDGGNIISHGPVAPPDGDGDGGNIIAHGPVAPPDGDGDGGNIRLV